MSKGGDRKKSFASLQQLAGQFPAVFLIEGPRKPLKLNMRDDLLRHGIDRRVIQGGLGMYCSNYRYLIALQEGAARIGLDGEPAGIVTADEAAHARQRLAEQLKPKPAPTPQLEKPTKSEQPKAAPQASPKAPPQAPPKPKAEPPTTPFRKGRSAGNKAVVVEVKRQPAWKHGSGPKRTFNV